MLPTSAILDNCFFSPFSEMQYAFRVGNRSCFQHRTEYCFNEVARKTQSQAKTKAMDISRSTQPYILLIFLIKISLHFLNNFAKTSKCMYPQNMQLFMDGPRAIPRHSSRLLKEIANIRIVQHFYIYGEYIGIIFDKYRQQSLLTFQKEFCLFITQACSNFRHNMALVLNLLQ